MSERRHNAVAEEEFFARYGSGDRVELVDGEVVPTYGADGPSSPNNLCPRTTSRAAEW